VLLKANLDFRDIGHRRLLSMAILHKTSIKREMEM
jgi:hypothetical protein